MKTYFWICKNFYTLWYMKISIFFFLPMYLRELVFVHFVYFTPDFSGVCVTRSLVLCVCFVDRCLSFCSFSFGHCVVCPSSIYRFWLPLWYLQTHFETVLIVWYFCPFYYLLFHYALLICFIVFVLSFMIMFFVLFLVISSYSTSGTSRVN
jgi:hypothetical protein